MTLDELKIGQPGRILAVGGQGALRHRLLDMGLTPNTRVMVRKVAPMGDPLELFLRGYELTLRIEDAKKIEVEPLDWPDGADHPNGQQHRKRFGKRFHGGDGHGLRTGRQPELR